MARGVIFVGPSAPPGAWGGPHIVARPPARRGDLSAAVAEGFTRIGLVDGELYQSSAVTPAEVREACRYAMVFGAASLGALRAVEVKEMIGVGEVFAAFRDGVLEDDDELVGTWNTEDGRTLAWPLVIVREALRGSPAAASTIGRMKSLPFHERSAAALARIVSEEGGDADAFLTALRREPNVKQRDGAELIRRMGAP